jgi:DNA-binding transcriptional MocR family regulator
MRASQPTPQSAAAAAKFKWIDQVCRDDQIGHLACRIASLLVPYFNRQKGYAWPSQRTLAKAAGVTTRSVQNSLQALKSRGHLATSNRTGRVNHYAYKLAKPASHRESIAANSGSKSHERSFGQYQETPLKRSEREAASDFGPALRSLALELSTKAPGSLNRRAVK